MTDERLTELEKAIAWERKAYHEWKEHYEANKHAEPNSPEHDRWLHLSMAHEQASSPLESWGSDGTVAELIAEIRRLRSK